MFFYVMCQHTSARVSAHVRAWSSGWLSMQTLQSRWEGDVSDVGGGFTLSGRKPAVPMLDLTDVSCPSLTLAAHIMAIGWRPCNGAVVHSAVAVGHFDGRNPVAKKLYLMCIIQMYKILGLAASVRSDQPPRSFLGSCSMTRMLHHI